jgi:hypothetical protein
MVIGVFLLGNGMMIDLLTVCEQSLDLLDIIMLIGLNCFVFPFVPFIYDEVVDDE